MRNYACSILILLTLVAGCARSAGRTDQQVANDVQNKINGDASFPDKGLTINANDGVVTLSGKVSSDAARLAAGNDAAHVDGVKIVVNNLVVAPPAAGVAAQAQTQEGNPQASPARVAAKPSPSERASWRKFGADKGEAKSDAAAGLPKAVPSPGPAANATASNAVTVPPPPLSPQPITVPSGTRLSIRLSQELNSETAQVGDLFRGSISTPVMIGDATVIPTTADVEGRVVDVKSAGRFAGQSDLVIELTRLQMNGKSYSLTTDRWSKAGSSRGKSTATKVGGGAAVGAILGGIFGGGKGAAIGAAAGAGAGTGVSAAGKGQQIILKPETVLIFQLQNSISVTPGAKSQTLTPSPAG